MTSTPAPAVGRRRAAIPPTLSLYLGNRYYVLANPAIILTVVVGLSMLVAVLIGLATGELPLTERLREGTRANGGVIYGLPGFLMGVGAMATNRNFSLALSLGSSRRAFWQGTSYGFLATSLVTATAAMILLALERATHAWWLGIHVIEVDVLGRGYPLVFLSVLCTCLFGLYLGAFFGTIYRTLGAAWVVVTSIGYAVAVVALSRCWCGSARRSPRRWRPWATRGGCPSWPRKRP